MKCPKCGYDSQVDNRATLPDKVYIEIRDKKIGYQSPHKGQLKYWGALGPVYTSLEEVLREGCRLVMDDMIFECKLLGTREELLQKIKEGDEGVGVGPMG